MFRNARVIVTALSAQQPALSKQNNIALLFEFNLRRRIAHLNSLLDKNKILSLSFSWILPVAVAKGYATLTCVVLKIITGIQSFLLILCNHI